MLPTRRGNIAYPLRPLGMETTKLFALIGTALVVLSQPIWAQNGPNYSSSEPYGYYNGYGPFGQYTNGVVRAVQSKLASFGYYRGAIDGILGDETQAPLARYQQDHDLSVAGTVTAATLHMFGLP